MIHCVLDSMMHTWLVVGVVLALFMNKYAMKHALFLTLVIEVI